MEDDKIGEDRVGEDKIGEDRKVAIAEVLQVVERLCDTPALSVEEKIEQLKGLLSIIEEDRESMGAK